MPDVPPSLTPANHTAPVPRRIRAIANGETLLDTTRALYVWEWPHYPQYYVPRADVRMEAFVEGEAVTTPQGDARILSLRTDADRRPAGRAITASPIAGVTGTVRLEWTAPERWFEEDEEVFVHPRSPYKRVDAIRSNRAIRIEAQGTVLADARSCVMVFETGLPTRYYLDPLDVRFAHLVPIDKRTQCPYKGKVDGYWSATVNGTTIPDVAWRYTYTTPAMTPIAGLVAFLNERVDIFIDGVPQQRPVTHFT